MSRAFKRTPVSTRKTSRRFHEARRYACEALERRLMLCDVGTEGYYKGSAPAELYGTEGPDDIFINVEGGCSSAGDDHWVWVIKYRLNDDSGVNLVSLLTEDYGDINLYTLGGNDRVVVTGLRDHRLNIDLGTGNDTVEVDYTYSTTPSNFDGPARGIWGRMGSVLGGQGDDTIIMKTTPTLSNPTFVNGFIFDSNTFGISGTRVAGGFLRPTEPFFASGGSQGVDYNGVETFTLSASSTTAPTIFVIDSLVSTSATITSPGSGPITVNVAPFVGGNVVATGGTGNDIFNIGKQTNSAVTHVDGAGGSNTLNLTGTDGPDSFSVLSNGLITGHTVASYVNIQSLTIDGGRGADSFLLNGAPAVPYSVKGGLDNDTITLTENVVTPPPIDGGAGANTLVLDHHNLLFPVNYTFLGTGLQFAGARSGFFSTTNISKFRVDAGGGKDTFLFANQFPYFAEANGGFGDDRFTIGAGDLANSNRSFALAGNDGSDTLQLDDRFSAGNLAWTVNSTGVFLGLVFFTYAGFENVELFGNATGSAFNVSGTLAAAFRTNTGGGSDTVTLTGVYNSIPGVVTYPLYFEGGGPNDVLIVDDRGGGRASYSLYEGRITSLDLVTNNRGIDVTYFFFAEALLYANDDPNPVSVYGLGTDITRQTTLRLGGGNDAVNIYAHDAGGNSHFSSSLGIFGQGGSDQVVVDDTTNFNGVTYTVANLSVGTLNVLGMGVGALGVFSDVETLALVGGSGDDTVKVDSIQTGNVFGFTGGPGNDTMEVAPTSHNLAASLTSVAYFGFDGGAGTLDTFKLFNQNNPSAWTYTRQGGQLRTAASTGYFINFDFSNHEQTDVNAGNAADQFIVRDAPANSINFLTGGGGADTYTLGGPSPTDVLDGIRGVVGAFGDAADSVILEDRGDTTGDILHIDESFVGNFVGDTLFGPGGRVFFRGVANLTLNLGSGADTIYAQSNALTSITINANAPTTAPGDTLNLALAGAGNYTVTPTGVGAGIVSIINRRSMYYTGIEGAVQVDAVAPSILSGEFLFDAPKPGVRVTFSENVAGGVYPYSFEIENLTAVQSVPFEAIQLDYDSNTHRATLTFPGLPGGILADGNYRLTVPSAAFSDASGNYSTGDFTLDFFVFAGDLNRDRQISFTDLITTAANFGKAPAVYADGDTNYDEQVGFTDLITVAAKFGTSLPEASAALAAAADAKTNKTLFSTTPLKVSKPVKKPARRR